MDVSKAITTLRTRKTCASQVPPTLRIGAALAYLLAFSGCLRGDAVPHTKEGMIPVADGAFETGTVGAAASGYSLTMDRVRTWYAVALELSAVARTDTSVRVKLNYQLDSPIWNLCQVYRSYSLAGRGSEEACASLA